MWESDLGSDKAQLKTAVIARAEKLLFTEKRTDAKGNLKVKTYDYGGDTANINKMLSLVPLLVPDTRFIERNTDSSKYKLLFANGIYDMRTKVFTSGFDRSVVFFERIEREFKPRESVDAAIIEEVRDALFVKPFKSEDDPENCMGRFYLQYLARSIAGEYEHKKILLGVGNRNTGKGATTDMMRYTFEGYVSAFDSNNLLHAKVSKDESQKLMWVKQLRTSRIAMANEIDIPDGRPLNGNLINRLASGGDVITFRGICAEDTKVKWATNIAVLANDMLNMSPLNEGVLERVRFMRWAKSFKDCVDESELGPNELKADKKWRKMAGNVPYIEAFFWVIADEYAKCHAEPFFDPPIVSRETTEWVGTGVAGSIKAALETDYVITKDAKDITTFEEIKKHLASAGLKTMSDTKLGRELTALGLIQIKAHRVGTKVVAARGGLRERVEADYDPATIQHVPAHGGAGGEARGAAYNYEMWGL